MKLIRLTAFASLCLVLTAGFSSCEKDEEKEKTFYHEKTDIPISGAQVAPNASPSPATGLLSVSYDKRGKLLNYSITWNGLSDSVIAIRISGPAPAGFPSVNPAFNPTSNPTSPNTTPYMVLQQFVQSGTRALHPATGSFTGSLLVDDVKVKEQDLLNGLYFVTIHTKTTLPVPAPGSLLYRWFGEIRAQIRWQ